jgi:hypothetical protein
MREGSDPWGTRTRVQRRLAMTMHLKTDIAVTFGGSGLNLTICSDDGGDRSHDSKAKVAHEDKYCQEEGGVITLSLSNSFARKDFNLTRLLAWGTALPPA